jgi:hypothetical protein
LRYSTRSGALFPREASVQRAEITLVAEETAILISPPGIRAGGIRAGALRSGPFVQVTFVQGHSSRDLRAGIFRLIYTGQTRILAEHAPHSSNTLPLLPGFVPV